MTILPQLANALDRNDEVPNQELAARIADRRDARAAQELVENLLNRSKAVRSDCIKVLYEIGERDPELIAAHCDEFAQLLESSDNRLAWGAMTALDCIASVRPKQIHAILDRIVAAADNGSVITRDHAVGILIKLAAQRSYAKEAQRLLMRQLESSPNNQLPMYAENAIGVIDEANREQFGKLLTRRMAKLEKESQKKRIAKVLRKLES